MLAPTLNNLIETFALFSGIFLFLTMILIWTMDRYDPRMGIYFAGVVIVMIISVLFKYLFAFLSIKNDSLSNICKISIFPSNVPNLNIVFLSFTFFYFLLSNIVYKSNFDDLFFHVFLVATLFQIVVLFMNECSYNLISIPTSLAIGIGIATGWFFIIKSHYGKKYLYYSKKKSEQQCQKIRNRYVCVDAENDGLLRGLNRKY